MLSGDIAVCGHTTGSFSGFTNAGSTDYVVQKYSPGDVLEWTAQLERQVLICVTVLMLILITTSISLVHVPGL